MLNNTTKLLTSIFMLILTTTFVNPNTNSSFANSRNISSKPQNNQRQISQLEAVYAILMKDKPARYFNNRKPAILDASFNLNPPSPSSSPSRRNKSYSKSLHVTATAYTSHVGQTDSTPNIAAWGDRLYPGMKSIAVSRDLLKVHGLKHGQKVRIKGLKGEYAVLDKMNKRWKKKIDIYMGLDKHKAFKWGRRKVEILWN